MLIVIQIVISGLSVAAIVTWLRHLRKWPIKWAVVAAMALNVLFYVALALDVIGSEHNILSSVRVLLMVLLLAVLPEIIENRTL